MTQRSEIRANLLAALLAFVVFALLVVGVGKLLADEGFYPDSEEIAEHCEDAAGHKGPAATRKCRIRLNDTVRWMKIDGPNS